MTIKRTAGRWDPADWPVYFIAANMGTLLHAAPMVQYLLIAVNELNAQEDLDGLDSLLAAGKSVFVDSGVFWLSTQHAKRHGITMDEALNLPPDQLDDFDALFDKYTKLIRRIGDRAWGYIEIDQGGRENKIKTRGRLEAMGLRPIPVYHPFNDGWDYFDHLAQTYDRICFGNVVQADPETRKRLLVTAWERRRRYPHLWIHVLGLTPSERASAYPINSCDSSTWLSPVRWGRHHARVANKVCWETSATRGFMYDTQAAPEDDAGHIKARRMCGYEAGLLQRTMRTMAAEARDVLGCDIALAEARS